MKLWSELGWESLSDRRWFRRLSYFYKILNKQTPDYLYEHLPAQWDIPYNLRRRRNFDIPNRRTDRYSNSFYPYCISEWEKLSDEIQSSPTLSQFKNKLLLHIRDPQRPSFGIIDIPGIKLLTKLRVEFSDLRSHRFSHSFNCVSPLCRCLHDEESNSHFLLRCPRYVPIRNQLLGNLSTIIGSDVSILPVQHLTNILLYGSNVYSKITNKLILIETINYIRKTGRFDILEDFTP